MSDNPDVTVDGRFTDEGLSVTAYDSDGGVLDEAWFTHAEIDDLAGTDGSDFTFELSPSQSGDE